MVLGGQLYGGQNQPTLQVDTIKATTGQATFSTNVTGTTEKFWGLAPALPLPASLAGAAVLLGALAAVKVRRRWEN